MLQLSIRRDVAARGWSVHWGLAIFAHAQKSRSDGTMVARGFSPWAWCEIRARRGATPESFACHFLTNSWIRLRLP
jgi:hypothetical protein